jgi:hypothetical protein
MQWSGLATKSNEDALFDTNNESEEYIASNYVEIFFGIEWGTADRFSGLVLSSWLQIQRPGFDSRHYRIF